MWWMWTTNSLQLVAAPKYTGHKSCIDLPQGQDSQVYSFSTGKFRSYDYLKDACPDIAMFCQGLRYGGNNDLLLYLHDDMFKYHIKLFKILFECAITKHHPQDSETIRFKRIGLKPGESPFITKNDKFAFYAVDSDDYTFEKFMVLNDFNEVTS